MLSFRSFLLSMKQRYRLKGVVSQGQQATLSWCLKDHLFCALTNDFGYQYSNRFTIWEFLRANGHMENKGHVTFDIVSTTPFSPIVSQLSHTVSCSHVPQKCPFWFLIYWVKTILLALSAVPRDLWDKSRALGKDLASGTPNTSGETTQGMGKATGYCFIKIHHCVIAKVGLKHSRHLAFRALLRRGLRCSQRPMHKFIIGKLLYFRMSRLHSSCFEVRHSEKWHVSGDHGLEPEQAVTFVPSIPDGNFISLFSCC